MSKREKCCGGVIVYEGKVLMVQQGNEVFAFPKGHVEKGETEVQTALREILEETGVVVELDTARRIELHYHIESIDVDKEVVLFMGKPVDGIEVRPQEGEIEAVEWVAFDAVEARLQFSEWKEAWGRARKMIKEENE